MFQKYKILPASSLLIIIVIITGFLIAKDSIPGDQMYFAKHLFQMGQISTLATDKDRATERLSIITTLVHNFDSLAHKNPKDTHLVPIADEIIFQSSAVTLELDRMKKQNGSVKTEAGVLCEALEKQAQTLRFLTNIADPSMQTRFQNVSKITDKYVDAAMKWEGEK